MLLFTVSCSTQKDIVNYGVGRYMTLEYDTLVSKNVFEELCVKENINPNYNKWLKNTQRDFETNKPFTSYLFISKMDSTERRYRLIVRDSIYNLNKITTSNVKK